MLAVILSKRISIIKRLKNEKIGGTALPLLGGSGQPTTDQSLDFLDAMVALSR
jgi:hypothetical protein